MIQRANKTNRIWILMPVFGALLFVVLYVYATFLYPGGSQAEKNSLGFSWINNYWCNLLNDTAINGQPNGARPVAMAAMAVLCLTLSFFWFLFPKHITISKKLGLLIQVSGIIAMSIALLLFTSINHDMVTNLASFFGLIATLGTFTVLYKAKWFGLFAFGLLNILLVIANNYVYYSNELIVYLPVIQKVTFITFLSWICAIHINLYLGYKAIDKR
jgi:hypothetical protein